MTQLKDWADQLQAELEKQSSARSAQLESLLFCADYQAIRDFIDLWESEDKDPDSLRDRYSQTVAMLKLSRCCSLIQKTHD